MFVNNLAYEASAGSGKTFMLVVRYLSLLFQGADPSKILALTFTNKAASEMSQRVVETLEDLENRGELLEIAKVTEIPQAELLQKKAAILEEFLNANTKIMTIDSFFTQILRKFSLYSSLMPDFSTFASQHELKLMSRFLVEVRAANKQKTLINLSLASKKRLSDLFTLLDDFYTKKEELKSFTFAPTDIKEPIQKAQIAFENLRALVHSCDGASKTALKSVEAKSFEEICAKSWIGRETLDYRTFSKCYTPEMDRYLHEIQEAIASYYRAKEQNFFSALLDLSAIYKKSKKALYQDESELSFNDVTALVYEILHLLDDSEFLYFRLDAKIEHMLLDEFQDTSVLQYAILRPLIKEITSGKGIFDEGSFFFVGDVKQSIYRFRGGVSALFDEVAKDNNTQVEKLVTNYRSQKEVVSFVNDVFIDKIKNYTPQLVREGVDGGYVEVLESEELIDETLTQVQRLIDKGVDLNDIAILCATNGDGEEVKLQLQAQKIEVVTETTTKLIAQKSVKALIEYLKYIYFQEDIYRYNFFALIDHELEPLAFVDLNRVKFIDIVKNIINKYGLFEDEFHLVRFMDLIVNYKDIEAFLFEYERIDTAAAASDLQGVRVLTVHKSKGLEYEHVIVLDRLKRKPASRDAIIYEYDGIVLKNIYLRSKSREDLDTAYANAIAKEKELVKEDTLNALYVAFTRAREHLFIIKKVKDSSFDLLDLTVGSRGVLECKKIDKKSKQSFQPLEYKSLYYGTQSDILELESQTQEELDAINFGIAMHYTLEMMEDFTLEGLENGYHMMLNKYGYSFGEKELADLYKRISILLEHKEFLALTQGKCYKEKALRFKNQLRYIDLLVESVDGVWKIIDYKSSMNFAQHHHTQVHFYVKAIEAITGEKAEGYLCYLLEDRVKIQKV